MACCNDRTSRWLFATALLAVSVIPLAAESAQVVDPGQVNLEHSRVYIHVDKRGLGHEHAVIGQLQSGRIDFQSQPPAGELVFDMAGFQADTEDARRHLGLKGTTDPATRQQVNENMHGPQVLDVERFPTARFEINSLKRLAQPSRRGLPQLELAGKFTLHGETQPIRVVVDEDAKDGWLHWRGGFTIRQSQYGITPFSKALGAVGVADELKIWGDLWVAQDQPGVAGQTTARR